MLQVALTPELERQLADIAARTGDAPDELARRALLAYLEDVEDMPLPSRRGRSMIRLRRSPAKR